MLNYKINCEVCSDAEHLNLLVKSVFSSKARVRCVRPQKENVKGGGVIGEY